MFSSLRFLPMMAMTALSLASLSARELRVNPQDRDSYPSIQAAVNEAKPGDVISIAGGVYYEAVEIEASGTPLSPIILRPFPNEPVVINAGRKVEADWKSSPHLAYVYEATVPVAMFADHGGLWEMPARLRLANVHSPEQVSRRLGSWHFRQDNEETGTLYIRGTASSAPPDITLWLERENKAAITLKGSHLQVYGLSTTLGQHGFLLPARSSHITVEDCRAYCNSGAGMHVTGAHHVIAYNETFLNNTYGIQLRHGMESLSILHNRCYYNGPNNGQATGNSVSTDLGIYGKGHYNLFEGNLMDGLHEDTFRNKGSENPTNLFRNNVIRGNFTTGTYGVEGNTFLVSGLGMRKGMFRNGGDPAPQRSWERVDPTGEFRRANLVYPLADHEDPLFADPAYRDFRLQEGSPYGAKAALAHAGPIYYVDPVHGSDENDGLNAKRPMATVAYALARLPASATLYLMPGIYTDPIVIHTGGRTRHTPFRLRAYQKSDQVIIRGGVEVDGSQNVVLEHLRFEGEGVTIRNSPGVKILRSTFHGNGSGVLVEKSAECGVERCTFERGEIRFTASPAGRITHCLFAPGSREPQADAESTLYTAFNGFSDAGRVIAEDDFTLIGAAEPTAAADLQVQDAEIRGLAPTVATVLWNSPRIAADAELELRSAEGEVLRRWTPPMIFEVFGEQFDMRRPTEAFFSSERHVGIDGLSPGNSYELTITQLSRTGERGAPTTLSFTTPKTAPDGKSHYVSPTGDNGNDGSRGKPWRTLAHAVSELAPGDELVLRPGVYREILRPRISGSAEQKIRIRSEVPHQAVIDLEETLPVAVEMLSVHHLEIEGLHIRGGKFPYSVAYLVLDSRGSALRNGRMGYPKGSDFAKLKLGYSAGVLAHLAPDLMISNHLFLCAITGVSLSHSPRSIIEHNTFACAGNYGVAMISGTANEPYTIRHNLFYRTILGYKTNPCIWAFGHQPNLSSDGNLFYIPEGNKGTIAAFSGGERLSLAEWQKTGQDRNSRQAEPRFTAPEAGDFRLLADSPGKGAAPDGTDIGITH